MHLTEEIRLDLEKGLSQHRFEHSLLVANEAKKLASYYHFDEEKAYIAGLVHDIAKELSDEENRQRIEKYHLPSNLLNPEFDLIIHADIGAEMAKEKYQLDDEICNAIKYHTIGNVNMSDFDKIIFIADKIGRKNLNAELENIKKLAYQNLDMALLSYLTYQKKKLKLIGKNFHPNSKALLKKLDQKKKE